MPDDRDVIHRFQACRCRGTRRPVDTPELPPIQRLFKRVQRVSGGAKFVGDVSFFAKASFHACSGVLRQFHQFVIPVLSRNLHHPPMRCCPSGQVRFLPLQRGDPSTTRGRRADNHLLSVFRSLCASSCKRRSIRSRTANCVLTPVNGVRRLWRIEERFPGSPPLASRIWPLQRNRVTPPPTSISIAVCNLPSSFRSSPLPH